MGPGQEIGSRKPSYAQGPLVGGRMSATKDPEDVDLGPTRYRGDAPVWATGGE